MSQRVIRVERRVITSRETWLAWRRADITASTIAALFGLHPFETVFGIFAQKSGAALPDVEDNVALQRGRDLEQSVAGMVQRAHPTWKIRKANVYLHDSEHRLGATPDYFIRTADGYRGVLQCKTVNPYVFKREWTETDAPAWIVLQTLTEAMLARASFAMIAALEVDGWHFRLHEYQVPRHAAAELRLLDAVASFWADFAAGKLPQPDYRRDGALIAAMNPNTTPGKSIDLRTDNAIPGLLEERAALKAQIDAAMARKDEIETEIKAKIGDAEVAIIRGWNVTLKEIHRKEHVVRATSFRQLRAVRQDDESSTRADAAAE
jgi:predicted phage-related endonuclease